MSSQIIRTSECPIIKELSISQIWVSSDKPAFGNSSYCMLQYKTLPIAIPELTNGWPDVMSPVFFFAITLFDLLLLLAPAGKSIKILFLRSFYIKKFFLIISL